MQHNQNIVLLCASGGEVLQEKDDDDEEEIEPKTQTENAGDGGGSNKPTRIGASMSDDEQSRKKRLDDARAARAKRAAGKPVKWPEPADTDIPIVLDEDLTVKELAALLGVVDTVVIKTLFMWGVPRTVNQIVETDWARDMAISLGYTIAMPDSNAPPHEPPGTSPPQ